jgi:tripartite-type tricarboxylate transporter receptor subunit TctC
MTRSSRNERVTGEAMKPSIFFALAACTAAIAAWPGDLQAQKFPGRAITYVVPLAAGSTTDVAARLIAQRVSQSLGANIIIENKPGASTMLGSAAVAKAEPDGHTLLMGASSLTVNQSYALFACHCADTPSLPCGAEAPGKSRQLIDTR